MSNIEQSMKKGPAVEKPDNDGKGRYSFFDIFTGIVGFETSLFPESYAQPANKNESGISSKKRTDSEKLKNEAKY